MKLLLKKIGIALFGEARLRSLQGSLFHRFYRGERSFSQEGEDRVLMAYFRKQKSGFYVDVGAHHPKYLSNTHLFYTAGWRGLNIDADPNSMPAFRKSRPRDINVCAGVGAKPGRMKFYSFTEPALNTFNETLAAERQREGRRLREVVEVEVLPLCDLLQHHVPNGVQIDFLSVDVEGLDLEVLRSNSWEEFRPRVILVECLGLDAEGLDQNETYRFLKSQSYKFIGRMINTCIFADGKIKKIL